MIKQMSKRLSKTRSTRNWFVKLCCPKRCFLHVYLHLYVYMDVSENNGTLKTPQTQKWSFLVGKPMVVGYHHFRKHPYILYILYISLHRIFALAIVLFHRPRSFKSLEGHGSSMAFGSNHPFWYIYRRGNSGRTWWNKAFNWRMEDEEVGVLLLRIVKLEKIRCQREIAALMVFGITRLIAYAFVRFAASPKGTSKKMSFHPSNMW